MSWTEGFLIDTPGFDDTYSPPNETLRMVSVALASTYANDLRVASVLYLNSMSQKRMFASMRLDYQMFREICGSQASTQVTMTTTHWDSAELESPGVGAHREEEFRTKFWGGILDEGAALERIEDYESDVERIIDKILRKAQETEIRKRGLQIQEELLGKKLRYTLEEIKERLGRASSRKMMVSLQKQLDAFETKWFDKLKGAFDRLKRKH
ncbi:hypothetical protein FA13DRAFT_1734956 [Coprinellus micaceus]|uniref:G domain-containing protein n=1 Tax=Coprinellus micaceus TaxID=71717 RepID=A0A4Y7T5I3_COPMI|nr:hypothetical protein FA13DRAFT_1734956 [Coprinellus micaceus]